MPRAIPGNSPQHLRVLRVRVDRPASGPLPPPLQVIMARTQLVSSGFSGYTQKCCMHLLPNSPFINSTGTFIRHIVSLSRPEQKHKLLNQTYVFETPCRFLLSFLNPRSSKSAVCSTRYEGPAPASPLCLLLGNCSGRRGEGDEFGFQPGLEGWSSSSSFSYFCGDRAMGGLYIFPGGSRAGHLRVVEAGGESRVWSCLQRGVAGACRGNNLLSVLQVSLKDPHIYCAGVWPGKA